MTRVESPLAVVVTTLKEADLAIFDGINEAISVGDTARPGASLPRFERLRLADPNKGITQHCIYEIEDPERDLRIGFDPPAEIIEKQ